LKLRSQVLALQYFKFTSARDYYAPRNFTPIASDNLSSAIIHQILSNAISPPAFLTISFVMKASISSYINFLIRTFRWKLLVIS
jgi:hypothetical protein